MPRSVSNPSAPHRSLLALGVSALAAVMISAGPASADDNNALHGIVDELRVGLLAHDPSIGGEQREQGVDIHLEAYFPTPAFLEVLLKPRPAIGVNINTNGETSSLFTTLAWTYSITADSFGTNDGFFVTGEFGGAVHDGNLNNADPNRKALGSRFLFHESIQTGYTYEPERNVAIYIDHMSNAGITQRNAGLTEFGLALGFGF